MSQQGLDLRRSVQIVRRHKILVGIMVAVGLLIGGAYATLNPPMLTSTALIVLPQSATSTQQRYNIIGAERSIVIYSHPASDR